MNSLSGRAMTGPRKLGDYELVDRLAVGGMAEIYRAKSRSIQGFEKEYVLKLIHPKNSGDQEFMRMLVDEAKLTAQLHHVNIAQVIDLGVQDDNYFIVMEYVRGRDLYQILNEAFDRNIAIPLDVCAFIARELAAGLHYAHSKRDEISGKPLNLVHRDISPQNVLVSWYGEVKIVDFGVAKAALAARPETQAGVIKGKFRYMSPEQAWGEKLDGRSDLFSAGLCLYEMATASMAYDDDPDMRQMLVKMREAKFRPPSELRNDINATLEGLIMRALKRRRHERYSTAEEFEGELNAFLHSQNPSFTRARVRQFLAQVFPDDVPYDVPPPIAQNTDSATEPVASAVGDSTRPLTQADLIEDVTSTDDHTIRQSIVPGKIVANDLVAADEEFADEATSLWESEDNMRTDELQVRTASMSNEKIRALVAEGQPDTVEREAYKPTKIPTAWIPQEVPDGAQAPMIPSPQAPRAIPTPGFTPAPPAPSNGPQLFRDLLADDKARKLLIPAVLLLVLSIVLMIVFVSLLF